MPKLSLQLLGTFTAVLGGRPLTSFRTRSVQALLIYLACEAERPHQREALMELLWPGMPQTSAQANVRQTVYRLRKLIPEVKGRGGEPAVPFLLASRQTVQVNPDAEYYLDVDAFEAGEPAQAIPLYRGDFLADFYLPDSETFEEWVAGRRAEYRRRALALLETETAAHIQQADYDRAIRLAQRQLAMDNLREGGHRQLMEAWARSGRRQEALSHYETLRQLLRDELGIEPEPETVALVEAIRAGALSRTAAVSVQPSAPPEDEPEARKHNLPQRLTSFVGREKEIATVIDLLDRHRLVMLTGVGGIGKTNLCLQVGRRLLDAFRDGVWLVELAPLADPELVPQGAAHALGLGDVAERSLATTTPNLGASPDRYMLQRLLRYLQERDCLLILDNCEHLISATARFVETVLQACPGVKVLASSREALGVPGEVPFRVPSLSLPDTGQLPASTMWQQYDALSLFVDRATAVLPTFQVTPGNFAHLVQICRRLDGIPLALELAAARVKMLTTQQIAARLDDRFRLLTGGSRTALPRQQTLRALIDWSWELLTPAEQLLLQRLSVFAGGMTLEAVEAVCGGEGLEVYDVLDLLSELVNKSLVLAGRQQGQETRYQLLETIRQYAQERLVPTGQGAIFRQRHLDYFLTLAEQAGPALTGPDQVAWLQRLEQELDNLRLALNWALESDREAGIRLITTIFPFWDGRYVDEAEAWLSHYLAEEEQLAPQLKAKAYWVNSGFNWQQGHFDRMYLLLEKSLALYRELGDRMGEIHCQVWLTLSMELEERQTVLSEALAYFRASGDKLRAAEVLHILGHSAGHQNNYEQASAYLRESESLYRELGHLTGIAGVLGNLGHFAIWQDDYEAARPPLEESLAIEELLGSRSSSNILHLLGILHLRLGDYLQARTYLERSLSLGKQTGEYHMVCWTLVQLGYVSLRNSELAEARRIFGQSLRQFQGIDNLDGVEFTLEGLASLDVRQGQAERAVRLFAWADATREATHNPRPPVEQADVERDLAASREMVDEEAYAAAYAEGRAMTMEQAIALAAGDTDRA